MSDESSEYNRQDTIDEMLQMVWLIHMLPLFIALFFVSSIGLAMTFPLSFVVWLFIGDRPIHRMPPANFFFLMFWGVYWRAPLRSEFHLTRTIFQLSQDFQLIVDHPYRDLFKSIVNGRKHPVTGFEYTVLVRFVALIYFVVSFVPFFQLGWAVYVSIVEASRR